MQRIQNWGEGVMVATTGALYQVLGVIPALLGALIILGIGWIVGGAIGRLGEKLLHSIGFERVAERTGFTGFLRKAGVERMDASALLGQAVNWTIRLVFLQMAADALGLRQVTVLLNQLIAYIPNLFVAALILVVAGFLGRLLQGVVRGAMSGATSIGASFLDDFAYWAVMVFGIIAALNQLNIAPVVVNTLFIGLVATVALALGLSFGLGGREAAAEVTRSWLETTREVAPQIRQQVLLKRQLQTEPTSAEAEAIPERGATVQMPRRSA